jgi:L-fucose isomerase-like protein
MSRLSDEGHVVTMEGDIDGTLLALAGQCAGAGFGFLTDWLEHHDESIHFWHAGMAPLSWCSEPRLGRHFNTDQPLVVDGAFRADEPMTVARIWPCDGGYRAMAFEGLTIADPRPLTGNTALLRVARERAPTVASGKDGVNDLFESLLHAGMPHHVALFRGHHRDRLRRLMRLLNIEIID